MGNLPAVNLSLDHTALALSLFQDGAAVNQSLIILHSTSVCFARASDSEAELCLLPFYWR